MTAPSVHVGDEVAEALAAGRPVVALESTIFSELGLPEPRNREALARCEAAVRAGGAFPALTAVLDGRAVVGVESEHHDRICGPTRKVAARDLGVAVAQGWSYGATTVSASVRLAQAAGIAVFATGGIGGVHRGAEVTGDVSADLDAIAGHRVVTVSAGAKVFLDLARTLEYLETASVPVLGWRCAEFPAFHAPSSGLALHHRVDDADAAAAIAHQHWALGGGGLLLTAPVPAEHGLALDELLDLSRRAEEAVAAAGITGPAVTPAVLERLAALSGGRVIEANLALAEHNAGVAAAVAGSLASMTADG